MTCLFPEHLGPQALGLLFAFIRHTSKRIVYHTVPLDICCFCIIFRLWIISLRGAARCHFQLVVAAPPTQRMRAYLIDKSCALFARTSCRLSKPPPKLPLLWLRTSSSVIEMNVFDSTAQTEQHRPFQHVALASREGSGVVKNDDHLEYEENSLIKLEQQGKPPCSLYRLLVRHCLMFLIIWFSTTAAMAETTIAACPATIYASSRHTNSRPVGREIYRCLCTRWPRWLWEIECNSEGGLRKNVLTVA